MPKSMPKAALSTSGSNPVGLHCAGATGSACYNVYICRSAPAMPKTDIYGVVNRAGNEIVIWATMTNSVERMTWLPPKEVQELMEKRDDFFAPR